MEGEELLTFILDSSGYHLPYGPLKLDVSRVLQNPGVAT